MKTNTKFSWNIILEEDRMFTFRSLAGITFLCNKNVRISALAD